MVADGVVTQIPHGQGMLWNLKIVYSVLCCVILCSEMMCCTCV